MQRLDKKEKELQAASLLAKYFSEQSGNDFWAELDKEDRDADCFIISKQEIIKIQVVTNDGDMIRMGCDAERNPGTAIAGNPYYIHNIIEGIGRKALKYSEDLQRDKILLICSEYSDGNINQDFLKKEVCEKMPNNEFKKVYYAELPEENFNGSIIEIK